MTGSIFRSALADDFARLHPRLQELLGEQRTVTASGVFARVGARTRWMSPVFAVTARWGILFPERGQNVPFDVSLRIAGDRVVTERHFHFAGRTRVLRDETRLISGRLVDVHAGRVLVRMSPRVEPDGSLVLRSTATRLRLGSALLWVPPVLIGVHQWWDERAGAHGIRVRVLAPLIGEVFGYRGTFRP